MKRIDLGEHATFKAGGGKSASNTVAICLMYCWNEDFLKGPSPRFATVPSQVPKSSY
jgi:hypothetical protein